MNITSSRLQGVSVVICCYNSARRLLETLQHLAAQQIPLKLQKEIILVDNASTDETGSLASEIWDSLKVPDFNLYVIQEQTPGQMYARKTGVEYAAFEIIVFCDDDNHLDEKFLANAYNTFHENYNVGAAGGKVFPVSTSLSPFPDWFDAVKDQYATGIPAETSGEITWKGFILGAGLITRKSLFLAVFTYEHPSLLPGRNGDELKTGDDFEYCKRLVLWDWKLWYNEHLTLNHFIPTERLTRSYYERLQAGILQAGVILEEYDMAIKIAKKIRHKSKLRLVGLAPLRILMAKLKLSKRSYRDEQLVLFYSLPFDPSGSRVRRAIKKFIEAKKYASI